MAELTKEKFEAAKARGAEVLRRGPLAERVRYESERNRIVVGLNTGAEIEFDPSEAQGLENAVQADLENVEIEDFGLALHWPTLDADHWVPALAEKFGKTTTSAPSNYIVVSPVRVSDTSVSSRSFSLKKGGPGKGVVSARTLSLKRKFQPGLLETRTSAAGKNKRRK